MDKSERGILGGHARAAALTTEQKSEIGKRAASVRWGGGAMRATHMGEIELAGVVIPCAVLEDGRRVLSARQIAVALGRTPGGSAYKGSEARANLPVFLGLKALKPFVSDELTHALSHPVNYQAINKEGLVISGVAAPVLAQICAVWLDARQAGALQTESGLKAALKAEILLRGFAEVGISALIDEATGYQEVRDRRALQLILDKYLKKELSAWAKQFPDEFYKQIFRLRDWEWRGMKVNRPQCVGLYTRDIVYERLAPAIIDELETRNPVTRGRRMAKHHQWLTADVGHPALSQHLHAVIGLMRVSKSWDQFKIFLNQAFPKKGDTIEMAFTE